MSFKTKIAALAIASLTIVGGVAATTQKAEAGWKGAGIGFAAGALLGAGLAGAAYASGPAYVGYGYGYRHCRWVNQYNGYGYFVGRTRVCSYPAY